MIDIDSEMVDACGERERLLLNPALALGARIIMNPSAIPLLRGLRGLCGA